MLASYTNLQNRTHCRRVTPFTRSQKSQHKYIFSTSGWNLPPIINKSGWKKNVLVEKKIKKLINWWTSIRYSRVGTKFRLKMTLLNFWIKLTQKGYFRTKKNENYHRILHIQINLDSKFPVEKTKNNITLEFFIFKLVQVPIFSLNWHNCDFLNQIYQKA